MGNLIYNKKKETHPNGSVSAPNSLQATHENEFEIDAGPKDIIYSKTNEKVKADDFEIMALIGKGSFGKVFQVKKKDTGKIFAMKVLRKDTIIERNQVAHTKAERSILEKIQHPFIVNLNYAFQTPEKLYMILDFINGGELFFHLKKEGRFSEERVRLYVSEITLAIEHMHKLDIVYRDLKPENILLDMDGHITITDFGLSKEIVSDDAAHTFCGTPEYLAPEVLKGTGHGKAVDWWSLGTLMYEMLTGLPPYYSQNVNVMYKKILTAELKFPAFISPDAKNLLEGLLQRDVNKRFGSGFKDADEIKSHPFFASINWKDCEQKKITPVFKPKITKGLEDITQIDTIFTKEKPEDSIVESQLSDTVKSESKFDDFTYTAPGVLRVGERRDIGEDD
jgi:serine/threonine protein kinase